MKNENKSALFLIAGKSGSGKTTLCDELERLYGLRAIPSYTTRQPRTPDEKGHTFITEEEFDKLEDIIAYAKTDSCRYAVTKDMLEDERYSLYVIDMSGIKYLHENYHGDRPLVSIYIESDVYDRFRHMIDRHDDRSPIDKIKAALSRIEHDTIEFNNKDVCANIGYIVNNREGDFDGLVKYVKRIYDNYDIGGKE